jgi:hypothetical protein
MTRFLAFGVALGAALGLASAAPAGAAATLLVSGGQLTGASGVTIGGAT